VVRNVVAIDDWVLAGALVNKTNGIACNHGNASFCTDEKVDDTNCGMCGRVCCLCNAGSCCNSLTCCSA
jgi:hypothetical protein